MRKRSSFEVAPCRSHSVQFCFLLAYFFFFFFFLFLFHRSRYLHVILGTIRVCRSLQPAEYALVSAVCLYTHTWKPTRSRHLFRRIRWAVSIFRGVSPGFAYRLPASRVKNDANLSRWSSSAVLTLDPLRGKQCRLLIATINTTGLRISRIRWFFLSWF